jgi:peptidoglycan/LPS O-acetylase OafA/YrhL
MTTRPKGVRKPPAKRAHYTPNPLSFERYIAEIDGLRGVSVLLVMAFHLSLPYFGGGFLGVDAFFVISGYLITRILIAEINRANFSYTKFLLKRAKRLLPALAVATALTTIGAWVFFSRSQLSRFGDSLLGVGTYTSNFVFLFDGNGYFQQSAANTPLLHTWSLAVEEQFYLLFPIFVLLFYSARKTRQLFFALFVGTIVSLALWIWAREVSTSSFIGDLAFFMLPTRAWELGAGGLVALFMGLSVYSRIRTGTHSALVFLGFTLLVVALVIGSQKPIQGMASLLMVLSMALLIAHSPSSVIGGALRVRWLVNLGLISYGLYLFHYPLLAFTKIHWGTEELNVGMIIFVVLGTFSLAAISYQYVEIPIRRGVFSLRKTSSAVLVFISLLAALGGASKVPAIEINPENEAAQVLLENHWVYVSELNEMAFQKERLRLGGFDKVETIVSGSSRTMQINSKNTGKTIVNLSLSASSLEEVYSLSLAGLEATEAREVLIGLDPWFLNSNSETVSKEQREIDFAKWSNVVAKKLPLKNALQQEYRISETDYSVITSLYNLVNARDKSLIPAFGAPDLLAKRNKDGSLVYSKSYTLMSEQEIYSGFDGIYRFANMNEYRYSAGGLGILRDLLAYLKDNKVEVTLILSPFHPDVYSEMSQASPGFLTSERAFRGLADSTSTPLIGSYDPNEVGCLKSEFYDGMHPTEMCMKKILKVKK